MSGSVGVIAGGAPAPPGFLQTRAAGVSWLVAADRGAEYARCAGLVPNEVIGDMDSVSKDTMEWLLASGIPIHRHPTDKDQSDLELALTHVLHAKFDHIEVWCGFGDRIDHLLTNVAVLLMPKRYGIPCRMVSPEADIFYVLGDSVIEGAIGDTLTLLATSEMAEGIWTEGLRYPLAGDRLWRGGSRGLSNVLIAPQVTVRCRDGDLLAIHVRTS